MRTIKQQARLGLLQLAQVSASVIGIGVALPAAAQEASSPERRGALEEIIVTARRREENLQDVPISITVYNEEMISQRNIVNSADLGIYTPSLSTNMRFGPEKASFAIRGFQQDLATQPSVGTYFADVVAPRSGGQTTSGNGVGVGHLFDLQNVQVLKGPQGTLFGRNTTGGAVLIVPQRPNDELGGYVEASLGNYDMWRVQAVHNLPISDRFKLRLGVDRMENEGYLKNHSGIGPNRLGDIDYIAGRVSFVADITDRIENYTITSYVKSDNHNIVPRVVGVNTIPPAPVSQTLNIQRAGAQLARAEARGDGWWDVENSEPNPRLWIESWQVINTTTWQATDSLTIKNIASYAEFRELARMSLQGENFLLPDGSPAPATIRLGDTRGYKMANQNTYTEELQLQGTALDGRFTWQGGGYFENSDPIGFTSQSTVIGLRCTDTYEHRCNAAPPIPFPNVGPVFVSTISRPYQKTWFRNRGLYAQGTYDVTDQFAITAGLRYTWDTMKHRYDGMAIGFPATNTPVFFCSNTVRVRNADGTFPVFVDENGHARCNVTFKAKSDEPTWLLNFDYKPIPDALIYAKWARGYRAGGVASANIYFETWKPEKVDTYEIGTKNTFNAGWGTGYLNVAGFYNDFRNQQIQETLVRAPTSPLLGGSAIINAGKSRIWGGEIDASVTFFDQLRWDLGYTYLNTKLRELEPVVLTPEQQLVWAAVVPTAVEGGRLAFSPKHRLSTTLTYTLPLDQAIGRISLGATWVHTSKQVASLATDPAFGVLPESDLLNLNVSWNNVMDNPFDVSFFMTNATNEKFPLAVSNAWRSYGFESQITNVPRMYGMRMKLRFGSER